MASQLLRGTSAMMPSASSLWSSYMSFTTSVFLIRTMFDSIFPHRLRGYLYRKLLLSFSSSSTLTLIIQEEDGGIADNQLYSVAETYLSSKINPDIQRLRVSKIAGEDNLTVHFDVDEKINDTFEGVQVKWVFVCRQSQNGGGIRRTRMGNATYTSSDSKQELRQFELSFDKKHKSVIFGSYFPYIQERSKAIKDAEKLLRIYTLARGSYGQMWDSVILRHPATFQTLAMDVDQKKAIIDDLDRFVRRKSFYNEVGRAWKRGYLLYGPPGTGKSSLIAAMANYLRFSVFDLQLSNLTRDADLRKLLLSTSNKSLLVIEDIDCCSVDFLDRRKNPQVQDRKNDSQLLSLSGLLNFIDGLWSCCGDERIIVFTTNHKEKIDPALLRPGRMDMHIHMSYCTPQAFETLASNYLGISPIDFDPGSNNHPVFSEIRGLLENAEVTPADIAEQLMKSEDPDIALAEVVKFLKRKRNDALKVEDKDEAIKAGKDEDQSHQAKRQKVGNNLM